MMYLSNLQIFVSKKTSITILLVNILLISSFSLIINSQISNQNNDLFNLIIDHDVSSSAIFTTSKNELIWYYLNDVSYGIAKLNSRNLFSSLVLYQRNGYSDTYLLNYGIIGVIGNTIYYRISLQDDPSYQFIIKVDSSFRNPQLAIFKINNIQPYMNDVRISPNGQYIIFTSKFFDKLYVFNLNTVVFKLYHFPLPNDIFTNNQKKEKLLNYFQNDIYDTNNKNVKIFNIKNLKYLSYLHINNNGNIYLGFTLVHPVNNVNINYPLIDNISNFMAFNINSENNFYYWNLNLTRFNFDQIVYYEYNNLIIVGKCDNYINNNTRHKDYVSYLTELNFMVFDPFQGVVNNSTTNHMNNWLYFGKFPFVYSGYDLWWVRISGDNIIFPYSTFYSNNSMIYDRLTIINNLGKSAIFMKEIKISDIQNMKNDSLKTILVYGANNTDSNYHTNGYLYTYGIRYYKNNDNRPTLVCFLQTKLQNGEITYLIKEFGG